ncbi:MAG: thrombospondin type 3 repeat-containing protein, partial [Myxococcota bacterium]
MRALISTAAVTGLAFALVATTANAAPIITFGSGFKLPAECTVSGINLDCTAAPGTVLNFRLVVIFDVDGTAGASFSAEWDAQLENALGSASAAAGTQTSIEVSPGPPPVLVGYTPAFGGPGVTNSSGAAAGSAQSWSMIASTPDSDTNILTAGFSYKAGGLTVTVDEAIETFVDLGFFQGGGFDVFIAASGAQLTPTFGSVNINFTDSDGDGVADSVDNCPAVPNPG